MGIESTKGNMKEIKYTVIVDGDTKQWWVNGERHREDGPAIEWADGSKQWWVDGKLHREDGPACEYVGDVKKWYVNGKKLTEAEFNAKFSKRSNKKLYVVSIPETHIQKHEVVANSPEEAIKAVAMDRDCGDFQTGVGELYYASTGDQYLWHVEEVVIGDPKLKKFKKNS